MGGIKGGGQGRADTVVFRIGQGQRQGSVAAHGVARDVVVLPPGAHAGEEGAADLRQLLADEGAVAVSEGHVRVPAQIGGGHDHGQSVLLGVAFHGGAAGPDGVVVAHAVEQPEGGIAVSRVAGIDADVAAGPLGDHHVHRHAHSEDVGEEVDFHKSHRGCPPLSVSVSSRFVRHLLYHIPGNLYRESGKMKKF